MNWRDLPLNPPTRTLRWFAVYAVLFVGVFAVLRWRDDDDLTTAVLAIVAFLIGLLAIFRPQLLRLVFAAALIVTFPIGWFVSHAMLFTLFYGMFLPMGIFFRCIGRDPLALRLRPEYKSYWTEKQAASGVRSYFHQS